MQILYNIIIITREYGIYFKWGESATLFFDGEN
jgi:hypothetical protein